VLRSHSCLCTFGVHLLSLVLSSAGQQCVGVLLFCVCHLDVACTYATGVYVLQVHATEPLEEGSVAASCPVHQALAIKVCHA
jgi:hypothetical protein